jgi:hypothetical protein
MLPGFRFLLAAIVLSVSIVTFGLGAAALLRAAHEEFASIPARRVTPEPYFVQPAEAPAASLAMLRVEPSSPQDSASVTSPALALVEEPAPDAVPVPKVDVERLAALKVEDIPPVEQVKLDTTPVATPAAAPVEAEPSPETKVAALDVKPAPSVETLSPPVELIGIPAMTDGSVPAAAEKSTTKIAALGSPAATAETDTTKSSAKPDRSEVRKKQRAEKARERRRLAARRARLAAQQAAALPTATVQQSADPFGEAATQAQPTTRRRR